MDAIDAKMASEAAIAEPVLSAVSPREAAIPTETEVAESKPALTFAAECEQAIELTPTRRLSSRGASTPAPRATSKQSSRVPRLRPSASRRPARLQKTLSITNENLSLKPSARTSSALLTATAHSFDSMPTKTSPIPVTTPSLARTPPSL